MSTTIPLQSMDYLCKFSLYKQMLGNYINLDAVFSDETSNFVSNTEPSLNETIVIKLRTAKDDVDFVWLSSGELGETEANKTYTTGLFDYWEASVKISGETRYYFKLAKNGNPNIYFYNKKGIFRDVDEVYNFCIIPDFKIPAWSKGAVIYQIYVDRFHNGDPSNDVVTNEYAYLGKAARKIEKWDQDVAKDDVCNFYGGDLQGVIDKMTYLRELGVDAIYFNPIFVSPSNHKYDIQDYDYVDPHYGVIINDGGSPLVFERFRNKYATMYIQRTTNKENLEASNQLMIKLIEIAHDNNIKVILDGVFNHCGAFNKWLDKEGFYYQAGYPDGAYREKDSPYNNFFSWYNKEWPNNDCYDSWWGHDNHPKLAFENSNELYNYIIAIGAKWVSPPFNADGWRLDVAADLGYSKDFNHRFWRDFRTAVKNANPNAIILAEHYGDANEWLKGDQWDTIMNYDAFMEPVTWFLTGMEKHSEQFRGDMLCNAMAFESSMRYHMSRLYGQSVLASMNELSNHDHSRFLTRTNMTAGRLHTVGARAADFGINKSIMYEAVIIQMTWPGSPTIYYGDEAGLTGWTDPDNRRTYPWGNEDQALLSFHKEIIKIRKSYNCLKTGSLEYLFNEYGILSYGRWDNENSIAVIINNNSEEKRLSIPMWKIGINPDSTMQSLICTGDGNYCIEPKEFKLYDGILSITVAPFSSIVLKENK